MEEIDYAGMICEERWELSHNTHFIGMILPAILIANESKFIVEIGVDQGFISQVVSVCMRHSDHWGTLLSIDPNEKSIRQAKEYTMGLPVEHIGIVCDSKDVHWNMYFRDAKPDLVVVDGGHDYKTALSDFIMCDNHVLDGGIVIAHDFKADTVKQAAMTMMRGSTRRWNHIVISDDAKTALMQPLKEK